MPGRWRGRYAGPPGSRRRKRQSRFPFQLRHISKLRHIIASVWALIEVTAIGEIVTVGFGGCVRKGMAVLTGGRVERIDSLKGL
jgi:hypothetical protein